jgi:signal transduction histidine kinase
VIKGYLRYRRFSFFLWFSAVVVLSAVFLLSRLQAVSAVYAAGLAIFIMICACFFDYIRYAKKIRMLKDIHENISNNLHALPEPNNLMSAQYQQIIESLYACMRRQQTELTAAYSGQIEYYTMWLHQIKTPISAMKLELETKKSADSAGLASELFKIERYVVMALQYARMGNMAGDLLIAACPLDEIIVSSVKKYAGVFIPKNLYVNFKKTDLLIYTDRKWFCFIVEQLLSNAVKYTKKGGVSIYIENEMLVIEDTGIGIRSDDIDMIFEKGYTGYNGRNDRRASGLGLFMCKKIAETLNVKIYAESRYNAGAKFFIDIKALIVKDSYKNVR